MNLSMSFFIPLYFYSKHWIWWTTILQCWLCPLTGVFFDLWRTKNNQENCLLVLLNKLNKCLFECDVLCISKLDIFSLKLQSSFNQF